jgi:ethanolamine ammonia-lyase large subunit
MLNYQAASFHDILYLHQQFNVRPAPEFDAWLDRMDMKDDAGRIRTTSTRLLTHG